MPAKSVVGPSLLASSSSSSACYLHEAWQRQTVVLGPGRDNCSENEAGTKLGDLCTHDTVDGKLGG